MANMETNNSLEVQTNEEPPQSTFMSRAFLLIPKDQNNFKVEIVCDKSYLYQTISEDGYKAYL